MTAMPRGVLVVGLGNPARGDDGVGERVARRLGPLVPAGVDVMHRAGDVMALIEDWAGYGALVVVDASAPDGNPGRVRRFDLSEEALSPAVGVASSHAFGLAEAVAMARALGLAPELIIVYAIEGADFDSGAPLSAAVAAAVDGVVAAVLEESGSLQQQAEERRHA